MIWDFLQRYDESWIWRCTDNYSVTESRRNFAALEECMADAARHGYASTTQTAQKKAPLRVRAGRSRKAVR